MDPMCVIHLSCSYLEYPCCLVNVQVEGLAINSMGSLMRILSVDYDSLTHVEGQKFKASCFFGHLSYQVYSEIIEASGRLSTKCK